MKTLTKILKGGKLSRDSGLYQFLSRWTPERVEKIGETCQLRAALGLAGSRLLKNPVVWLLSAVLAMVVLALLIAIFSMLGLVVADTASDYLPETIPAKLYDRSFSDPLPLVLVYFSGLGIGASALVAIPFAIAAFGVWKAMRRWSIVEPLFYFALATAVCIFAGWTLFSEATFKDLVGIVFTVVFTVTIVGGAWGVCLAVTRLRRWFAETYLWAFIKRRLCLPFEWVD